MKHLFIVTWGRSGSTLLQAIVNSLPGHCIRGENGGALRPLFKAWRDVAELRRDRYVPTSPSHPWYGSELIAADDLGRALAEAFVRYVLAPPPETRVIGFKEIRYIPPWMSDQEFRGLMNFMRRFFPSARFIFNFRDIDATSQSGWWREEPRSEVIARLTAAEQRFRREVANNTDCFAFEYDRLTAEGTRYCRHLLEWLGEPFDEEGISLVLNQRHSY